MRSKGREHDRSKTPTLTDVVTPSPRSASRSCRRSSRAGSTRSTRPAAGRCSSSSPARCASASRRGSPRPRPRRSATRTPHEIELLWPGLAPPYTELFAWLEGRADKPVNTDPAPFRPAMLAHAIEEHGFRRARSARLHRGMEMGRHPRAGGRRRERRRQARDAALFAHRRGHFQELSRSASRRCAFHGAIDGELLIVRDGRVQSFNVLQQRLNRKAVTPKLLAEFPAHLRAYDLLVDGDEDLRELPFAERRARLEAFIAQLDDPRIDLSPLVPFDTWDELDRRARRSGVGRRRRGCRSGRRRHAQAPRRALSCPAGRKACGGSGSAIRSSSTRC